MTVAEPKAEQPPEGAPSTGDASRLTYMPALDGLRAVLLLAVFFYHSQYTWAKGGLFAVSTFFTLSGFLITSLILAERAKTGTMNLRTFFIRRVRRLMPAGYAGIAFAIVFAIFAGDTIQRENLAGDVTAAVFYVANWRFILEGQSYADLFAAPSPLQHYWTLAIEEQFYLLFPLAMFAMIARGLSRKGITLGILGAVFVCTLLPIVFQMSQDRVYYGTDTRAPELLMGAVMALLLNQRSVRVAIMERHQMVTAWVGVAAFAAFVALVGTVGLNSEWLYRGGLAGYTVISVLIIMACALPVGPLRRALDLWPLRHFGQVSYGAYVFHWPIFLWLDERTTGLDGAPLFGLRFAATLAAAEISYHLIEQPIRHGRTIGRLQARWLIAPASVSLLALAVLVTTTTPPPAIDYAAADAATAGDYVPPPVADPNAQEAPAARIAMFGDSAALITSFGLQQWAKEQPDAEYVGGVTWIGCGVARGGVRRSKPGDEQPNPAQCDQWEHVWAEAVTSAAPNVAVVQVGPWESLQRQLPGDPTWRSPGDPVYDEYVLSEFLAATDVLSAEGAQVVWLTSPPVNDNIDPSAMFGPAEARDPAKIDRINQLIEQLPELRPGIAHVLDLATWLEQSGEDLRYRPDGVHFGNEGSVEAAELFLGPSLMQTFRDGWQSGREARLATFRQVQETITPAQLPAPGETMRVLVWGDATAIPLSRALDRWGQANNAQVGAVIDPACGLVRPDRRRVAGTVSEVPEQCRTWEQLSQAVDSFQPHVVVLAPGYWEIGDQQTMGDTSAWGTTDSTVHRAWLRAELGAAADAAHSQGAAVLWATVPYFTLPGAEYSGERVDHLNSLIAQVGLAPVRRPWSRVIDLATQADDELGGDALRPDGANYTDETADVIVAWMAPEMQRLLDELARARQG